MKQREDGRIWYAGAWRTPEQIEKCKAKNRERAKKKWWADKEYREKRHRQQKEYLQKFGDKINEKRRAKYHGDLDRSRADDRAKKAKQRATNAEQINARQREYYRKNAGRLRKQINDGKIRRDPSRGLATALREFERGDRSFADIDRLYSERLALANARNVQKRSGTRNTDAGYGQGSNCRSNRQTNQRADEDQT